MTPACGIMYLCIILPLVSHTLVPKILACPEILYVFQYVDVLRVYDEQLPSLLKQGAIHCLL